VAKAFIKPASIISKGVAAVRGGGGSGSKGAAGSAGVSGQGVDKVVGESQAEKQMKRMKEMKERVLTLLTAECCEVTTTHAIVQQLEMQHQSDWIEASVRHSLLIHSAAFSHLFFCSVMASIMRD
jgi:hypothetical protein